MILSLGPGRSSNSSGVRLLRAGIRIGMVTGLTRIIGMARKRDWNTTICFSISMGVWITAALWLIVRQPWTSVFGVGMYAGWLIMDCMYMAGDKQAQLEEIIELEKQVCVLRSRLSDMVREEAGLEVGRRRAASRPRITTGRLLHVRSL